MKIVARIIVSAVCLFAAVACYVFGAAVGGALFLLFGLMLEGLFWFGLFGRKKRQRASL